MKYSFSTFALLTSSTLLIVSSIIGVTTNTMFQPNATLNGAFIAGLLIGSQIATFGIIGLISYRKEKSSFVTEKKTEEQ